MNGMGQAQQLSPGVQYVVGTPAQTPVLRVLRQPIHDSEELANAATATNQLFTNRQTFNSGAAKIFPIDTNMTQDGSLGTPLEFDLVGFNHEVQRGVAATALTLAELKDVYTKAGFTWIFGQNTIWLQTRITRIPYGVGESGSVSTGVVTATPFLFSNGIPGAKNIFSFVTPDRKARRVNSTESFRCEVPFRAALVMANTQIQTVYMVGILYAGI